MSLISGDASGGSVLQLQNGGRLGFRQYGDLSGEPLIYFHGWPASSSQGEFLDAAGAKYGMRVIAIDRPGLGKSSRIPERNFLHVPPLVEELAEALQLGPCDVLGMSGGGPYALACAWALPHRVRTAVVCCGAPPADTPEARRKFSPVFRALLALQRRCPGALRLLLAPLVMACRIRPPWPLLRLMTMTLGPRDREFFGDRARFDRFYPSFREAIRSGRQALYDDGICYAHPWPFDVSEIRVPVRIWHGTGDTNFHHSLAARVASRIPNAVIHLREEGHYSLPGFCAAEILCDLASQRNHLRRGVGGR
jgi:pimeloyl-ACP methyl ester carboxylesterase